MSMSAFGIEDSRISKSKEDHRASAAGTAAVGGTAGGLIGHVYGSPKKAIHYIKATKKGNLIHVPVKRAMAVGAGLGALYGGYKSVKYNAAADRRAGVKARREAARANTVSKEAGDKKKTKYLLAGAGGYAAGGQVGSRLGARSAGTTYGDVTANQRRVAVRNAVGGGTIREGVAAARNVPGGRATLRGGVAGSLTGLGLGAGAYALHRRKRPDGG
jgi:hypothetical protein